MRKTLCIVIVVLACVGALVYAAIILSVTYLFKRIPPVSAGLPMMSVRTIKDVTYCRPGLAAQAMDVYVPHAAKESFPLIVYVHGGSWVSGSKDEEAIAQYLPTLAQAGYVVASINYRLAPQYTFPAQVQDVKCAIRFLRTYAATYHVRSTKVAVVGESAGGYLAAFTGTTGDMDQFKTAEYGQTSDRVQAVIDISGPTDFTNAENASGASMQIARTFLGTVSPTVASPITYVDHTDPPFLILHGQADVVVPPIQAQTLQAKLIAVGVSAELLLIQHAGHNLTATSVQPSLSQLAINILTFLHTTLGT